MLEVRYIGTGTCLTVRVSKPWIRLALGALVVLAQVAWFLVRG